MNFAVLGGDARQSVLSQMLFEDGHNVKTFGLEKLGDPLPQLICGDLISAIKKSDIVILPLPVSRDSVFLNAPFAYEDIYISDIFTGSDKLFLGGKVSNDVYALADSRGIRLFDYLDREEFAIFNAVPTAEGAIEIAMRETQKTIFGSKCLCIGYGKIGKVLTRTLLSMGANVTTSARKFSDLSFIELSGATPIKTSEICNTIHNYEIVFNTVPYLLIGRDELHRMNKNALIIDLASSPGGVDFDTAKEFKIKAIHALSLPGKVAPITAAQAIKTTVMNIISEEL